ncbi:MAG: hypothetical protein ACRDFZ_07200 [Candidatus Limnocylindria bacterium]
MAEHAERRPFMTATQRRPGFRLKWSPEGEPAVEAQRAKADMSEPAKSGHLATAAASEPHPVEPSDQFLDSLTAAMRRVADDARETSLADARAAVAAKIDAMRVAASVRAEELRSRAEQDTTGIGDWSRAEIARIEAETQRKIEQRQAQLTEQLEEHDRRSAADIAALAAQVEQYEGELALFFAQLGEIKDPDTFIAAARRMPRLPQSSGEPSDGGAEADESEGHGERLRSLGIDRDGDSDTADGDGVPTNGVGLEAEAMAAEVTAFDATEPAPAPGTEDAAEPGRPAEVAASEPVAAAPSPAAAPAAVPVEAVTTDTNTMVAAVGLGSFGAVTSFKSALEKTDGITNVRLSLGSGGEFMYSVTHRADLDLAALVTAAHPGASVQRSEDGILHLSAGKRR